jgi:hypothetical protein
MERSFGVRKGAWTKEEDILLRQCVENYGEGNWHQIPLRAGSTGWRGRERERESKFNILYLFIYFFLLNINPRK